jgi:hypothetical protein
MIYLDIMPGDTEKEEFYTAIAHELQHNINFIAILVYPGDSGVLPRKTPSNGEAIAEFLRMMSARLLSPPPCSLK